VLIRVAVPQVLADRMGYAADRAADLARHLELHRDDGDLWMSFDWCADERLVSPAGEGRDLEHLVREYAMNIADDLKEHRGRSGESLPWD
jgi:hypothetical protein